MYIYTSIRRPPPMDPPFCPSRGNLYDLKTCSGCICCVFLPSRIDTGTGVYSKYGGGGLLHRVSSSVLNKN